jgi:hypothetical protein
MSRADYAHWNEDADWMWWHEEGKHVEEPEYNPDDYLPRDDLDPDPCSSPDDCIAYSSFSLKTATGQWECDVCGRRARVTEDGMVVPDWVKT